MINYLLEKSLVLRLRESKMVVYLQRFKQQMRVCFTKRNGKMAEWPKAAPC